MTFLDRQADLDDLLASCLTTNGRRAFAEAVACFRAGAYRACIVATWTALAFDFLGKLRDLELAGNVAATQLLAEFEAARVKPDIPKAQQLERDIISKAADEFELLTPIEREDLRRLQDDRNRCAHPAMLTLDEPYQPTAEQARSHMRNAVQHMLARPAVQGKEAAVRVWADIDSAYFPTDVDGARQAIASRIRRARPSLLRSLLAELVKRCIDVARRAEKPKHLAALQAVVADHAAEAERFFTDKLGTLVANADDASLVHVVDLVARVPLTWTCLPTVQREKIGRFMLASPDMRVAEAMTASQPLLEIALEGRTVLSDVALSNVAIKSKNAAFIEEIVRRFESASSYYTLRDLRPSLKNFDLLPVAWTQGHLSRLSRALTGNTTIRAYVAYSSICEEVFALGMWGDRAHDENDWLPIADTLAAATDSSSKRIAQSILIHFEPPPVSDDEPNL